MGSRPDWVIPKTIINMVQTASLHRHACVRVGVQSDCFKGLVVSGTVYGDMHLIDLLGSITRVGYCIPVLDFYLVLHGHSLSRKKYNGLINLYIHINIFKLYYCSSMI